MMSGERGVAEGRVKNKRIGRCRIENEEEVVHKMDGMLWVGVITGMAWHGRIIILA